MSPLFCILSCSLGFFCCPPKALVTTVVPEKERPPVVVVFLHGTGESGPEEKDTVKELIGSFSTVPNLRFIFPTARPIKYSPFPWNGQVVNTWYDINAFRRDAVENNMQMEEAAADLVRIIDEQVESGVPLHRICVVGFSRGGSMAIHLGYEYVKNIGCVGAMSSWLPTTTSLYQKLVFSPKEELGRMPPLYLSSGTLDPLARTSWVEDTAKAFRSAGVPTSINVMSATTHKLTTSALRGLFKFIELSIK